MLLQSKFGHPGDTAVLLSPPLTVETCRILTFKYHMKPLESQLQVRLVSRDFGRPLFTFHSMSGGQTEEWLSSEALILPNGTYRIAFVGSQGATFNTDIALDDVGLNAEERCEKSNSIITNGETNI